MDDAATDLTPPVTAPVTGPSVDLAPQRRRHARRARPWLAPIAVVAVTCVLPLVELWRAPGSPMEEGFMLVFPELVLEGHVPNRDFLHLYGPGSLWALAGVFKVFGTTLAAERVVGLLQQVGVVFGVFALLRPWGRWVAAAGGAVAAVILLPPAGLVALAWPGGLALSLWALNTALDAKAAPTSARHRSRRCFVAGVLAGLALLYRPDLVLAIGLATPVLWWGLDRGARRALTGGLAVGVSPYAVHVAMAGVGNVVEGLILDPVFELRPGRSLPVPPSWGHFDGFLQRVGALVEPSWPLPAPHTPAQLSLWLGLLLVATAALVAAGVAAARRGDRRLLVMALFCVGLLPQAIQRADSTHLAWVSCVPLGLLPAAVIEGQRAWRPAWRRGRTAVLAAAVPVVATLALAPTFVWGVYGDYVGRSFGVGPIEAGTMRRGDRVFHYGRLEAVDAVNAMLPDLDRITKLGDTLFVGPVDLRKTPYSEAYLYYLMPELEPATRYIEMDPGIANAEESGMADELRRADVVVLSSIYANWDEPNDSRKFGPNEPNEVIEDEFCLIESYGDGYLGRGLFELYRHC
ncbi:MAG TPA: hypothetical protein VFH30_17055 [Acidimicrobiales bacterium]|nr:hypothetical protein [Acidimicrobiales bacterium]